MPDGNQLLTGDAWGGVHVWEIATGKLIRSQTVHRTTVTRFEHSQDGRHYASLSTDGSAQVWNARTHATVGDLLDITGRAFRASFSPIGDQIATPSSGAQARVWDIHSGLPLNEPMDHPGEAVTITAYSPDGRFVSTTTDANAAGLRYNTLWPAPPNGRGVRTPKWLLQLATIAAGRVLTGEGKTIPAIEEFSRIEEIRKAVADAPADDVYAEWGRWILSDSPSRPIAPGFTITPAEAEKVRAEFLAATKATGANGGN